MFVLVDLFNLFFLLLRKFVIFYPTCQDFRLPVNDFIRVKETIFNRFIQLVVEVGFPLLQVKGLVGASIHLIARRGGQANEERVEVVEDGHVLAENASVCFVNDNQIKSADRELLGIGIDEVNHRLVGREKHPGVFVGLPRLV